MPKKAGRYVRFKIPHFEGLQSLANALNEIPTLEAARAKEGLSGEEASRLDALRTTEEILGALCVQAPSFPSRYTVTIQKPTRKALPGRLEEGIRLFNEAAERAPMTLRLIVERDKWNYWSIMPGMLPETDLGQRLFDVFRWVVWWLDGQQRLKRCGNCLRWFVDRGRNKRAIWCSVRCAGHWWTRRQRKATVQNRDSRRKRRTRKTPKPKLPQRNLGSAVSGQH